MKFCGQVRCVTRTNWLDFGEDPNPDPTTRIFKVILHHWEIGLNRYITRYLKKLWTDSDETWWTSWVCEKDELIRFWWISESGSGYENYLIFKVILHHWEMGPKTIYSTISQKCIGPDMFSWIRHYMAEVCALPSALLVVSVSFQYLLSKAPCIYVFEPLVPTSGAKCP